MGERERALVGEAVDAFNRRDIERLKELTHPEGRMAGLRSALEGTFYTGHEGIEQFWAEALEIWDELRIEETEIIDGDDRALMLGRLIARGRGSGALIDQEIAWEVDVRDGLASRIQTRLDPDAARRDFEVGRRSEPG
jgi:ketosteroid isomerase-like protein